MHGANLELITNSYILQDGETKHVEVKSWHPGSDTDR